MIKFNKSRKPCDCTHTHTHTHTHTSIYLKEEKRCFYE